MTPKGHSVFFAYFHSQPVFPNLAFIALIISENSNTNNTYSKLVESRSKTQYPLVPWTKQSLKEKSHCQRIICKEALLSLFLLSHMNHISTFI